MKKTPFILAFTVLVMTMTSIILVSQNTVSLPQNNESHSHQGQSKHSEAAEAVNDPRSLPLSGSSDRPKQDELVSLKNEWKTLGSVDDLSQLAPHVVHQSRSDRRGELLAASFMSLSSRIEDSGWTLKADADLPSLTSGGSVITLHIKEGVILGAEALFPPQSGGAEWARIVELLIGQSALGGPQDPMMMLDVPPERPQVSYHSGEWRGIKGTRYAFLLELNKEGYPQQARLWLRTRQE